MYLIGRPAGRRTVSAVRVTPLRTMKTSPDLMPTGESNIFTVIFEGYPNERCENNTSTLNM